MLTDLDERDARISRHPQSCPAKAHFRQLTPDGRGAIAVVRIWGPAAIDITTSVFRPAGRLPLARSAPGRLRVGRIGDSLGDEVVAVVLDESVPTVEVQCHGGTAAVEMVMDTLEKAGAERHDPLLLTNQTAGDRLADEALIDLAYAPTIRTAEILLDQAQGALERAIARIAKSIDRPPAEALAAVESLIGRAAVGLRLISGWRVVIVGRPNVGKSRLLNALAGYPRAIVDPTPGTTRDIVTIRTSLGGWPVEIADTAGLRVTADVIENLGIARSHQELERADLVLLVLDRSEPLQPDDRRLLETTHSPILVANKSDLAPAWSADDVSADPRSIAIISADRGDGLTALIDTIVSRLVPEPPPAGEAVPFRQTHLDELDHVRLSLLARDQAGAIHLLRSMLGRSA